MYQTSKGQPLCLSTCWNDSNLPTLNLLILPHLFLLKKPQWGLFPTDPLPSCLLPCYFPQPHPLMARCVASSWEPWVTSNFVMVICWPSLNTLSYKQSQKWRRSLKYMLSSQWELNPTWGQGKTHTSKWPPWESRELGYLYTRSCSSVGKAYWGTGITILSLLVAKPSPETRESPSDKKPGAAAESEASPEVTQTRQCEWAPPWPHYPLTDPLGMSPEVAWNIGAC